MLKILIIEDEEPAAKRLLRMIGEAGLSFELLAILTSVSNAVTWFRNHPAPDLVFSDIQLSDGSSFDIFRSVQVNSPIIFITAFDEFAIQAFKLNSIDYLLKPVKQEELVKAIDKFNMRQPGTVPAPDIDKLLQAYGQQSARYKSRFIVRYGEHIKTIQTDEIAYFYTEDKVNFLTTFGGRRYAIDLNLDSLENMLDPRLYFRINRQFIISIRSIGEMFAYSKARVMIKLVPPVKQETIVSTERSAGFKAWLDDGYTV